MGGPARTLERRRMELGAESHGPTSPSPTAEKRYPDFRHALGTQYVCDAVLESARTKQWVAVKQA